MAPAPMLRVQPAPHWHGGESVARATWAWIAAASVPAAAGILAYGTQALSMLAVATATALLSEIIVYALFTARLTRVPGFEAQALLTGLLVGLSLPPRALEVGWHVPAAASLLATLVGKFLMGGYGNYLWHPVALGRIGVALLFGSQLAAATAPDEALSAGQALVAFAKDDPRFLEPGSSPLTVLIRDHLPAWNVTLDPAAAPSLADVPLGGNAVALALAAMILLWRGQIRLNCVVAGLAAAIAAAFLLPIEQADRLQWAPGLVVDNGLPVGIVYVAYHLTAGELLLVLLLLAGDSTCSPLTSPGQRWFGAGVGALSIALRLYGLVDTAGFWALLVMNTLVPAIDRRTKRRVYGT